MKKIVVDQVKCIGCGACYGNDEEHFDLDDAGLSFVKTQENLESPELQNAIAGCPTGAITLEDDSNNNEVNATE